MKTEVVEEPVPPLGEYADIPIAFEVRDVLDVIDDVNGHVSLTPRRLPVSYVKDYDASGNGPARWAERFDLSAWGFFSAFHGASRVGCATVARKTPTLEMLDGRGDVALLWDIRVAPTARRLGIGTALFDAAAAWASARNCAQLKVETQNINVAACRFYARCGCVLGGVTRGAYREFPDEIQLEWSKDLRGHRDDARSFSIIE